MALHFESDEDKYTFLCDLHDTINCAENTTRPNLRRRLMEHRDFLRDMGGWEIDGTCNMPIGFFISMADASENFTFLTIKEDVINLYKIMQSVPVEYGNDDDEDDEPCERCDSLAYRVVTLRRDLYAARERIKELEQELEKHGTLPISK